MFRNFKQNKVSGKALLFMGIYLIQLFCYQALIVSSSNANSGIKKCFSPFQQDNTNNSVISVFRTLEKHCEYGKETEVKKNITEAISTYINTVLLQQEITGGYYNDGHTSPPLLSDIAYKRYLKVNVFRI